METVRIEIKKAGINGEGIGFYKRKPAFVDGCFPGEYVECKLEDAGRHFEGKLLKILKYSDHRVKPECLHQKRCSACALMCLDYEKQLSIKKQLLQGALLKYAGYDRQIEDIEGSEKVFHYRNKCNLPVVEEDGKLCNALYRQGSNHPIVIDRCIIHEEGVDEIRKKILKVLNDHHQKAYDHSMKSGIRQIVVRGFDKEYQAVIISGNDVFEEGLIADLKKIEGLVSLYQGRNTRRDPVQMMPDKLKRLFGKEKIGLHNGSYRMYLSPKAFFQLNHRQAERIYSDVRNKIEDKCDTIVEAYCGIGAISLYLHDRAKKLIGIEIIDSAVKDAGENAKINGIDNVEFVCDDAGKALRRIAKKEKIDVLVVDPPRTGLDDELLETLLRTQIGRILYISCNPSTLGKDLSVLEERYEIVSVKGYDMFPQTPLVEALVELKMKKNTRRRSGIKR